MGAAAVVVVDMEVDQCAPAIILQIAAHHTVSYTKLSTVLNYWAY